jgi:hypothetical protein
MVADFAPLRARVKINDALGCRIIRSPRMARVPEIVCNNFGHASCVARRSATIVPYNRLPLPPSLAVGRNCSRQLCDTPAVHGGRSQLFPTIVRHSRRPWRSNTAEYPPSSRLAGAALQHPRCCILYFDPGPKRFIAQRESCVAWTASDFGILLQGCSCAANRPKSALSRWVLISMISFQREQQEQAKMAAAD